MSTAEIVSIGPESWEEFRAVRLASLADAPEAFGSRHSDWVDASEEQWRARLHDVPLTLVARAGDVGGAPVGVACGMPVGEDAVELISMWVDPSARGRGLADRLVAGVVAWAAERNRSTYLMVREGNHRAIAAYARAGFVDRGVPRGWPDDAPRERRMDHRPASL
jgi:ribosomal protein S18 acetylase RimI-like enzyme